MKTVNLSGCSKIPKHVYQDMFPLLEKLQVLDISQTKSGDSCLYILGAYCMQLRYAITRIDELLVVYLNLSILIFIGS